MTTVFERVVIVGAGGFGRETLDVVDAAIDAGERLELVGVLDSGPNRVDLERLVARGVSYLGTEEEWLPTAHGDERFIIAIGSPSTRRAIARRLSGNGLRTLTLIHPSAVIGTQTCIGDGVVIAAGVQVSTNVRLGDYVHLNPGSIIGHDVVLQDYVSVNPGAVVSGNVNVERETLLGAGSVVLQGLTVSRQSTVGAGSVVTRNIEAGATVVGVPARILDDRHK